MLKNLGFLIVALAVAGPIFAATPRLNQREHHQAQRIRQGLWSGELTRPETGARLQHEANVESKRIYRQKHDAQDRN